VTTDDDIPEVLRDKRLVVVDVEGNGQQVPEIVEVGILATDLGATSEDLRSWLIRPTRRISTIVSNKVHGITNVEVAGCPAWPEVADEIAELLADRTLIAHNASVEHRVLTAHLPDWKPTLVLDTLRLAKQVWPTAPGYSLGGLIRHGGIIVDLPGSRAHRAPYDAWCAWKLLCRLVGDSGMGWPDVVSIAALPGFVPAVEPDGGLW
jgi:DNA polymerase III epsilon subunit-like protein